MPKTYGKLVGSMGAKCGELLGFARPGSIATGGLLKNTWVLPRFVNVFSRCFSTAFLPAFSLLTRIFYPLSTWSITINTKFKFNNYLLEGGCV